MIIGLISQKGGVGKSTLARVIAREYKANDWSVMVADMDLEQQSCFRWRERRREHGLEPDVSVEVFQTVTAAVATSARYDLLVFDSRPHASQQSLQIAQASDLVIIPTGIALDDLEPTVRLAHELRSNGILVSKIAFALCHVGTSDVEIEEAKNYLQATEYHLLDGMMPERVGYRRASDVGKAATETAHRSLNEKADELVQVIMDRLDEITK